MGSWNLYFLLKLFLYAKGVVTPLWIVNLLFIAALAYPIEKRGIRALRTLLAIVFAVPFFIASRPCRRSRARSNSSAA